MKSITSWRRAAERFSRSHPYEATHAVVIHPDGNTLEDVKGIRSLESILSDFYLDLETCELKGPFDPEGFRKRFMGNGDNKPLYGSLRDVAELEKEFTEKKSSIDGGVIKPDFLGPSGPDASR